MILLVRHAESEWNRVFSRTRIDPGLPDPPLTASGRRQAHALAEELAGAGPRLILTSPYRRALETARILQHRLRLPVEVEPLVRERFAFSCDVGTRASRLREEWPEFRFDGLDERWWSAELESDASVESRCRAFWAKLREGVWPLPLVVVSHWGFLLALTGKRLDNGAVLRLEWPGGNAERDGVDERGARDRIRQRNR